MPTHPAGYSKLEGSERQLPKGSRLLGPCDAEEKLTITLYLRRRNQSEFEARIRELLQTDSPRRRPDPLTPEEFAQRFGSHPEDIKAIEDFAAENGLLVVRSDPQARTVSLAGTVRNLCQAFHAELHQVQGSHGSFRARQGSIYLPEPLHAKVIGVFGFDSRPSASPHFRVRPANSPKAAATGNGSFSPLQVAALYQFPAQADGSGETIGIIELGGGYETSDLTSYFQQLGLQATPQVTAVSVDGGKNVPGGDPSGADGEVELDIEIAGAIAPGAQQKIYFCPNTDQGFLDGITQAIHDADVTIVSISWGGPESAWTAQSLQSFNSAFQDAAALGKTIFVASGDNGSSDGVSDGQNHVDFPASSPFVAGCGGTTLQASDEGTSIASETVWNEQANDEGATGGGVSNVFALPDYQKNANVPAPTGSSGGRGVPDVAGNADPATGYAILVDGNQIVIGGTSAVAPLYAGLFARINQTLVAQGKSRAGFVNSVLYANPAAFRDITQGNNGSFSAEPGWDATTGLGSPKATALLTDLEGA